MTAPSPDRLSLRAAAEQAPQALAIVDGPRAVTYGDLHDLASRLAGALRAEGVGTDAPVGLVAEPRLPFLVCLHALIHLGVPVAPVHPRLRPAERAVLEGALGLTSVLAQDDQARLLRAAPRVAPLMTDAPIDPEAPLAIVGTSGTAGRPKGVILSRRAFVAAFDAASANLPWQDGDRWLLCMPPAHVGGLSIPLRTLLARRTTVCAPPGSFEPHAMGQALQDGQATLLSLVPTMLARLLAAGWAPPPHLRAVLLGGAGAPPSLLRDARDAGAPVLTTYGLTETCGQVATQRPGTPPSAGLGAGPPLPGVRIRIVEGEIQVRSPSLLSGLVGGAPPPLTRDGFLRTGDAGQLDAQGNLHVLGRLDDRIVTGGENVDPDAVERVLVGLPGIRAACVFGVPDPIWGQVVVAALVTEAGVDPVSALPGVLSERLSPHRRPRQVALLDDLPTTASGKVDRRAVARRAGPLLVPL
jgi:o-succinylbenzoate---CoA ligase